MFTAKPFYYLRHGETDWNLDGRVQGSTDIPLNETGRSQAKTASKLLEGIEIKNICCSPLGRARETAEIVNEVLNVSITVMDDLREANFGIYEGKTFGPWFDNWTGGADIPEAESIDNFLSRGVRSINQTLEMDGPVLIVAHGGLYWSIKHYMFGIERANFRKQGLLENSVPYFHHPVSEDTPEWQVTAIK